MNRGFVNKLSVVFADFASRFSYVGVVLVPSFFLDSSELVTVAKLYALELLIVAFLPLSMVDTQYPKRNRDKFTSIFFILLLFSVLLSVFLFAFYSYFIELDKAVFASLVLVCLSRVIVTYIQTFLLLSGRYNLYFILGILLSLGTLVALYLVYYLSDSPEKLYFYRALFTLVVALTAIFFAVQNVPKLDYSLISFVLSLKSDIGITYIKILVGWIGGYGLIFLLPILGASLEESALFSVVMSWYGVVLLLASSVINGVLPKYTNDLNAIDGQFNAQANISYRREVLIGLAGVIFASFGLSLLLLDFELASTSGGLGYAIFFGGLAVLSVSPMLLYQPLLLISRQYLRNLILQIIGLVTGLGLVVLIALFHSSIASVLVLVILNIVKGLTYVIFFKVRGRQQ